MDNNTNFTKKENFLALTALLTALSPSNQRAYTVLKFYSLSNRNAAENRNKSNEKVPPPEKEAPKKAKTVETRWTGSREQSVAIKYSGVLAIKLRRRESPRIPWQKRID